MASERVDIYMPKLRGKSVAVVGNATSLVGDTHLVDTLIENNISVAKVFAPEHGFRGDADAGATIDDDIDTKTGLPILSLYGANKKPSKAALNGVDTIVFDIQDVGVRFYTYLSTLHYVMEAAAENDIQVIVLDRPNPNGGYIDGPVLEPSVKSFVGLHPVPLVYGMTIGEYAKMINGEGWLAGGIQANLTVVPIANYARDTAYVLPIKPSPNLPTMNAVYLYPSLALFEGTVVSIGRGTPFPFEIVGHPQYPKQNFSFRPEPSFGARNPKLNGALCFGYDLRNTAATMPTPNATINLEWLLKFYAAAPNKDTFFLERNFFDKLAGNEDLRDQIKSGLNEAAIRQSWQLDLDAFKAVRAKYLIYPPSN
ncbi:exo-beta-N-acetylmuramidase NamZ domain-containing protein [Fretibacter rubidus]|uniref:exo-beta-N-acetylmuramidase NamZ family protein n=1 Tax=Fretibacter rubidus TaxID=570162 RepID=UPI00352B9F05